MVTHRFSPTFVLVTGLICAALACGLWAIASTIRNRTTVLAEADSLARSEPVREEFAWKIADALAPHNAASNPEDLNRANAIARQAVESPEFVSAFVAAVPGIYARMVDGSQNVVVLDPDLVNRAVFAAGATPPPGLALQVGAGDVPDLRRPLDMMIKGAAALGAFAILLITLGIALADHRGRAVMRVGRWLITIGALTIVTFWLLPNLAFLPLGGWISVAGIVLATGDWLAVPAALVIALGITILVMGRAGETHTRRQNLAVIPTPTVGSHTRPRIS